jgi:hypothetical protein
MLNIVKKWKGEKGGRPCPSDAGSGAIIIFFRAPLLKERIVSAKISLYFVNSHPYPFMGGLEDHKD